MITVRKAQSIEYYTAVGGVADGMESYYLDAVTDGEPPGQWLGSGAQALALSGEVDAEEMATLYGEGLDPGTGDPLGRRPNVGCDLEKRVAAALAAEPEALPERQGEIRRQVERTARPSPKGWDATLAVPKSVSAVHVAVHRGELAARERGDTEAEHAYGVLREHVEHAVHTANAAGMAELERLATTRVGGGSGTPVRSRSVRVVIASFFQRTNRNIDPHLHHHNVVANKVLGEDGKWRAIDGKDLLNQKYAYSAVADRVLFEELARLGFETRERADGHGHELRIVPEEVITRLSTRRQQLDKAVEPLVEAFREARGREPNDQEFAALKTEAQRATRAAKTHEGESAEEIVDRVTAMIAATEGRSMDALGKRALQVHRRGPVTGQRFSPDAVLAEAVAATAARSATWGRANLINEIELRLPVLGLDPDQVSPLLNDLAERALSGPDVVQVTGVDAGDYLAPSAIKYAAADTLAAESALRAAAVTRGRTTVDAAEVGAWLDAHVPGIGADQRAAVEGIASSDAALTVLLGPAGTGKSFASGALSGAWGELSGGGRVVGLAVSEVATRVLADDGIPHSRNVDRWLAVQERLETVPAPSVEDQEWLLSSRDIVMVDEASMVSTADLEAIRARVETAGARLVLTGDPRQLSAVEAGGVLGLLDGHAETYALADVRRFTHEWERPASLALRDAHPDALAEYDRHGRILGAPTVDEAKTLAARAAVADRVEGRSVVVTAASADLGAQVAAEVRNQLLELGLVEPAGVTLGRDGNTGGVGDVIMCRRNEYGIGVTNRAQYKILDTREDGGLLVAELPRPGQRTPVSPDPIEIPAAYVAEDVQSGYAGTVHAAQGLTVDSAYLVAAGTMENAHAYVALTRGRDHNAAYVALSTPGTETTDQAAARKPTGALVRINDDTEAPTALSVLEAGLDREAATSLSATVAAERDQATETSAATLLGRLEDQTRTTCRNRLDAHLDDLTADGLLDEDVRARLGADQGTEHLARLLRAIEQTGADPRETLRTAITSGRSLTDSESVAQVLSYRITHDEPVPVPVPGHELPTGISPTEHATLCALQDRIRDRTDQLGAEIAEKTPDWAVLALGPVPATTDAADRADWQARAGAVAAYREAVDWTHPTQPIGAAPGLSSTERRATFAAAWHALGRPEVPSLPEGQLRARITAWEREKQWAPRNVDAPLRAAETDLHSAHQSAALAEATGDHAEADRLRAEADHHTERVALLTAQAQARGAWLLHTSHTQDRAEAARAELHRRGLDVDEHPTNKVSAKEWLDAEAAARATDDAHRPITEANLTDEHDLPTPKDGPVRVPDPRSPQLAASHDTTTNHTTTPAADRATSQTSENGEASGNTPRPSPAHEMLAPSAGITELEAHTAAARAALAVITDRTSQDRAHEAAEQEHLAAQAAETGRRRREAAELDETTGTAHELDDIAEAGTSDD